MADAPGRALSLRGQIALALARMGFRVFPLRPGSKRPAITDWPALATTDEAVASGWWPEGGEDFNIGIATGRATDDRGGRWLVVIDYDCKPGQNGARALWWHTEMEGWGETYTVKTPNGTHRYYWCDREIANSVGKVAEHVDVRGRRGYVVAPGSVAGGREYAVAGEGVVAELPADLEALAASATTAAKGVVVDIPVDRIDSAWAVARAKEYLINEAPEAVSGSGGNNATFQVAAQVMDWVSRDVCLDLMLGYWNDSKALGPWAEEELRRIVNSAAKNRQTAIGSRNAMLEFEEEIKAEGERQKTPFPWIDIRPWHGATPPEQEWAQQDRIPIPQVGLLSGPGGGGKSIIELMRDVAHCTGGEWMGAGVKQGGAFYIGAEDDTNAIWRRLEIIARHYDTDFVKLDRLGLKVLPLLGKNAVLVDWDPQTRRVVETRFYKELLLEAERLRPVNISIDTLAKVFAGNEIERVQVYGFAGLMQKLALASGGAVTVLAHPSLTGMSSGSGISGSTAWHDAFRFRMYLRGVKARNDEVDAPDSDLRELEFKKNQYGPMSKTLVLKWSAGMFLPVEVSEADLLVKEETADKVFLALLGRFNEQDRNVCDKPRAGNYAPKTFAGESTATNERLSAKDLEGAMRRLFDAGKIHNQGYGKPSDGYQRLVVRVPLKVV